IVEGAIYSWIGKLELRRGLRLGIAVNLVTMTLGVVDQAIHYQPKPGPPQRKSASAAPAAVEACLNATRQIESPRRPRSSVTSERRSSRPKQFGVASVPSRILMGR